MFDNLSTSLQKTFKNLRGYGKLTDKNIAEALREIRLALLEADVHFQVAKDFIAKVKEKVTGEDVLLSVSPGQQFISRVHDELVELLGSNKKEFDLSGKPAMIMMLGLHGAGKTTTTSKLATKFKADGRKVLVVACDIRPPRRRTTAHRTRRTSRRGYRWTQSRRSRTRSRSSRARPRPAKRPQYGYFRYRWTISD